MAELSEDALDRYCLIFSCISSDTGAEDVELRDDFAVLFSVPSAPAFDVDVSVLKLRSSDAIAVPAPVRLITCRKL